MLEPVLTWMARPGHRQPVQGHLSLGRGALLFEGTAGTRHRIPFEEIVRVKRVRGSPVIIVKYRGEEELREAAFYFVEPGSLGWRERPFWQPGRSVQRSSSIVRLQAANRALKPLVVEWTTAIRRAAGR